MAEDSVLSHIEREFDLWGVKPRIRHTGGGHIELRWNASPDKPERVTYIPKTGSDWRGWMNKRAEVRRMFKQDNLSLKEPPKPEPVIVKALSLPTAPPPKEDMLRDVRVELATLTEMVFELADVVSKLQALPDTIRDLLAPKAEPAPEPVTSSLWSAPIEEVAPSMRSIKAIDHVGANWNSTAALAQSMGVEPKFAYRKLYYLFNKGLVEMNGSLWRKKPEAPVAEVVTAKKRTNGHTNGKHAPAGVLKRRGRPPVHRGH